MENSQYSFCFVAIVTSLSSSVAKLTSLYHAPSHSCLDFHYPTSSSLHFISVAIVHSCTRSVASVSSLPRSIVSALSGFFVIVTARSIAPVSLTAFHIFQNYMHLNDTESDTTTLVDLETADRGISSHIDFLSQS